jgi:hypothetical protein
MSRAVTDLNLTDKKDVVDVGNRRSGDQFLTPVGVTVFGTPTIGDSLVTCGFGVRLRGRSLAAPRGLWITLAGGALCLIRDHARIKVLNHDR